MAFQFTFDPNRCTGCQACVVACWMENRELQSTAWRQILTSNAFRHPALPLLHLSLACHHCESPACLLNCPADAYTRDALTGAVTVHADRCMGCRYCTWACPHDAPKFNPAEGTIEKCTFCPGRLEQGLEPACVARCPVEALQFESRTEGRNQDIPGIPPSATQPALHVVPLRRVRSAGAGLRAVGEGDGDLPESADHGARTENHPGRGVGPGGVHHGGLRARGLADGRPARRSRPAALALPARGRCGLRPQCRAPGAAFPRLARGPASAHELAQPGDPAAVPLPRVRRAAPAAARRSGPGRAGRGGGFRGPVRHRPHLPCGPEDGALEPAQRPRAAERPLPHRHPGAALAPGHRRGSPQAGPLPPPEAPLRAQGPGDLARPRPPAGGPWLPGAGAVGGLEPGPRGSGGRPRRPHRPLRVLRPNW